MNIEQLREYCISIKGATESFPFDETTLVFKVMDKMFAYIGLEPKDGQFCGIFVILLGQVVHYYVKKEQKPTPLTFGYTLLIFTIFGCVVEPGSGFWLFLPQALIIIFANKKI